MPHRIAAALVLALAAAPSLAESPRANPLTGEGSWPDLRGDIVGDAALAPAGHAFDVDAPYRAHDAATVPLVIRQTVDAPALKRALVVVDENPAPLVADFTFGDAMHPLSLEMRVRVNQYSNVRVIGDTGAASLMAGRFVKASGGCSAPATRDPEQALAGMGEMRMRWFDPPAGSAPERREAQIMIRHPNYSGLQRDQVTQLFINAHFIDTLEARQGEALLFRMEGGISISENPVFRFGYADNGADRIVVRATDTEGNVFEQSFATAGQG